MIKTPKREKSRQPIKVRHLLSRIRRAGLLPSGRALDAFERAKLYESGSQRGSIVAEGKALLYRQLENHGR